VKCEVYGCESDAFPPPHRLREARGWEWPTEVGVCNFHRDELSNPESRWHFHHDINGTRELRVGYGQTGLKEFEVLEGPTEAIGYGTGHEVSHPEDDGIYFPITVRQRGRGNSEKITLVMTPERLRAFAEFLGVVAGIQRPPQRH
jgi:hypothetical protein